jgi:predicted outer membrane repeat protein
MKSFTAVAAALCAVLILAGPSQSAGPMDAQNDMSWLDGFTLVVLETTDIPSLHQARATIQSHGGRVAIISPPSIILGWIPYERRAELIGQAGIKTIHDSEIPVGAVDTRDFQTRAVVSFFNSAVRGDIQREHFEDLARTDAAARQPLGNDALLREEIDESDYIRNLESVGLDVDRLKEQGLFIRQTPGAAMGNSDAMTGTIALDVFLVESNGTIDPNLYTWTEANMIQYIAKVNTGLAWWTSVSYNYFDCWCAFLVRYHPGTDVRCQQGYEPVTHPGTDNNFWTFWVTPVITAFGYTSGSVFTKITAHNTWQRSFYGTDWAYSAFIGYNPPGAPNSFTDGAAAWAYIGGPHTVQLYRSYTWDPSQVFPHETGHIFNACDEYASSNCSCACERAIGVDLNSNCENCPGGHTTCMMNANDYHLCAYTPAQVGWRGSGCAPAPLPAPVAIGASPDHGLQGETMTLTVTGSNFVYGASVDMGPDVTVNFSTLIGPTSFQVNVTIDNDAPPGLRNVIVFNRDLQSSTLTNGFEIRRSTRHYTSPSGGNVFPYLTPANAAISLADAIAATGEGDSLFLATATHTNVDLTLSHGLEMYGAWNPSFTTRNLASGKTALQLSGNIEIGPSATGAAVIDGFEIYAGMGTPQVSPIAGRYGGAVWVTSSTATVANCLIRNCQADDGTYGAGGGIYATSSTIVLRDTEIRDCFAAQGGAIFLEGCSASIEGCSIHDNDLSYSAQPAAGGGVYATSCPAMSLSGNTISGNTADPPLATGMSGGGLFIKNSAGVTMGGDVVNGNIAALSGAVGYGGGLYLQNSGIAMTSVTLQGNQAKLLGGAIYADATSAVSMSDGAVASNSAMIAGGAYLSGPTTHISHTLWRGNTGTACYIVSATSGSVIGNTMDLNSGSFGGALYVGGAALAVSNNIITNSTGSGIKCTGVPVPTPSYCDVWNNSVNYDGCAPGTGCISLDPLYVNAGGSDYHLAIHSPAIDSGDPAPAKNDPDGSRGDMGIYGAHAFVMDQPEYPKNLQANVVSGHTVLKWHANPEPDVASYAVYKNADENFIPSAANFTGLVAAPDTTFDDGPATSGEYYKVSAIDALGYAGGYAGAVQPILTGIGGEAVAYRYRLDQNHPNPFNPTTRIRYEVPSRVHVTLDVFDVRGGLVARLVDADAGPGDFTAEWDGRNSAGDDVSTGVYFYRLAAGSFVETRKMVLLK